LSLYHIPNDVYFEAKIFMGDNVPQAGYLTPRNFGMPFSKSLGRLPSRFADDFEAMNNCQKSAAIFLLLSGLLHCLCKIQYIVTGL